jgi:transmembrane sensor
MKKLDNIQKLIWEHSAQVNLPSPPDKEAVWMRLSQHMEISDMDIDMNQDQPSTTPPEQRFLSKIKPRITYAIALGLALIFVLPIAYDSFTTETFVTQKTDFQTIQLPDGSIITLNAESKIKYKKSFNTNHRSLTMTGEAYFDIKNGNTPFVIHTNQGEVTVLGTSFNVLSRKDGFEVGVNDGIVKVSNNSKSVILHKGQMIDVDSNFDQENLQNISYVNYPDWMHKKLVCEQTPLAKVCNEIERTFGISFEFANPSFSDITVTGIIDAKDLNTVLSTISLLTQHEFKFDGDTCTIF